MKLYQSSLILTAATLISPQVIAHVSHRHPIIDMSSQIDPGFIAGLAHPFSGADHILTLLLAGVLLARFAAGNIIIAVPALSLLMVSYIWLHSTSMITMNSDFIFGFLVSSFTIIGLTLLTDKLFISRLKNRHV